MKAKKKERERENEMRNATQHCNDVISDVSFIFLFFFSVFALLAVDIESSDSFLLSLVLLCCNIKIHNC